jgi:uncharacterized membrane protein
MRKVLMVIPIMTFLANIAILLDIPILREIIVFVFLSFIPGFAILRLFELKEISFLDTILFSVALSIAFVMFMGLLVNELYLFLGLSQPLSTIPLTVAISAFTLTVFLIEYRRDLSETLKLKTSFEGELKNVFPLSILLFLLPLLSALGVLYLNVSLILLSEAIIAALCVMSVVSRRLVPENLFPFLIFSISIALACQVLLTSKYIVGVDANLEYYVFKLTQINGHWGFLNANVNSLVTLTYNYMLSITLLPAVYSALMHAQGEIVFKILYLFIFSLVPLTLYRICEKQFGKLIGLLSALFFVFTYTAFSGTEPLSLNRQIVGELFLVLSVFLLISKTIPVTKRRWLLIIFGAALAVSHYSLAYIYLGIVAIVFIISRVKPRFDDTLNTEIILLLFVITFSWYTMEPSSPLTSLADTFKLTSAELTTPVVHASGEVSSIFFVPQVFTVATWINLSLSSIANLFLIVGILAIILRPKGTGISAQYSVMMIIAGIILVASLISPSLASSLNFTRFYAITLLFLSPCFVLGGHMLLATIGKAWTKIKRLLKRQIASKSKNIDRLLLLIAIILGGYFLSQVGFVNRVTNGAIHSYNVDFYRMIASNESQVKISLYGTYIPEQDVFSASWLKSHKVETAEVFGDCESEQHVLVSYGLIPNELLLPITTTMTPPQGSFVYLGSLNIVNGVISTTTGSFNTSEISSLLDQNNLVYSNGNSEIYMHMPM